MKQHEIEMTHTSNPMVDMILGASGTTLITYGNTALAIFGAISVTIAFIRSVVWAYKSIKAKRFLP